MPDLAKKEPFTSIIIDFPSKKWTNSKRLLTLISGEAAGSSITASPASGLVS
jgi:hypothetical protein